MKRSSLNFIIDSFSFLVLAGLAFTGFIMKFVLPPGTGGHGRGFRGGRGIEQVGERVKYFWSMTRHEWGNIHFWLAAIFIVMMIVHIILHWGWIKNYFKSLLGFSRQTTSR